MKKKYTFGKANLVIAIPDDWIDVQTIADLEEIAFKFKEKKKTRLRVATKYPNLTTNFIKDNVIEYRELSESAFKRSFERDKALLKDMGFLLDFENDKWKINDGYKLSGAQIFDDIKNNEAINIDDFINTYRLIKQFFKSDYQFNSRNINISKITQAINEKRRVSFKYKSSLRKVYPLGLKQYDNQWYVGANEQSKFKTFKIDNIDDLKLGTKPDLHDIELKTINFSWEERIQPIFITLSILKDHYIVQKNSFKHSLIKSNDDGNKINIEISTYDIQKLIVFILITDAKIIQMTSNDKRRFLEYLDEK